MSNHLAPRQRLRCLVLAGALALAGGAARATLSVFIFELSGTQEVPMGSGGPGSATAALVLSADETELRVRLEFEGLGGDQIAAHIHDALPGGNGPVILDFGLATGEESGSLDQVFDLSLYPSFVVDDLKAGFYYINIHSTTHPAGHLRGQIVGNTELSGANEVPGGSGSPTGSGSATVQPTADGSEIEVHLSFQQLGGDVVAAHIHEGPAGANGPVVVDLGLSLPANSGRLDATYPIGAIDLETLEDNGYYVNIHTTAYPAGDVRGQIAICDTNADEITLQGFTFTDEMTLRACERVIASLGTVVAGPAGHAILRALDQVLFDDEFAVEGDARLTVTTGIPLLP